MTIINTNTNNTSLNITGLVNNTQYRIRVAAVNSIGTGPYSEYIYAIPSALGADTDFYNVELLLAMDEVLNGDPYYGNSSLILASPGLGVNDDQYSLQTALLLHGDGIAITDSSLSNKNTSINGTVHTVADSRFGTASIRFNGSSYITYGSSSDFHVGTGDFTVETFIKFKTINGNNPICNTTTDPNGADSGKWYVNFNTTNGIYIGQHGTSNSALSAWSPVVDTWYHLAILRQSGTIKIYIDGVEQSVTNSTIFNGTDFNQNGFSVGKVASLSGFDAQIDEFRFTNGVARTISLPTAAYPNPSNPFRDLSPNTKKLSISGKPTISTTDAKTGISSIRLDSSSNSRLYIPHNTDFDFGNGDFTIEFWFKLNSYADGRAFLTKGWPATGASAFLFYANGSNGMSFYAADNSGSWNIASNVGIGSSLSMNTWYHAAVTRSGNTFRTFLNGTVINTWTNSGTLYSNTSHGLSIGNGETLGHPTDFWIDNLKIYKGLAKYTGNFTPSEDEVGSIASFDDASRFNKPVGNKGPTTITTAASKFGGASAYFDGNSYLSVPGDKAWQLGTDDFTIEAWINPDNMNGTKAIVGNYDGADGGWRLAVGSPSSGGTVNYGPEVSFTATNYGNEVDVIIPGVLEITRGDQQGIYNSAVEGGYQGSSPANTAWNRCREYQQGYSGGPGCCVEDANNWTNICNYATRTYGNWRDYGIVRNCYQTTQMVNKELIMKHVPTNRYWALKFTSWQSGGGGAFSYTRKEILGCTTDSSTVQFRNGNSTVIEKSISPPLASGTWYHLAASRANNSLKLFLDGNELGPSVSDPFTADLNRINTNGLTIGSSRSSSNIVTDSYKGYIDDLRITKGLSRYNANFTAPLSAFATLGPSASVPGPVSGLSVSERDNVFRVNITPPSFDGRSPITSYGIQYSEDGSNWNNTTVSVDPHYDKVSLLLPMTGTNNTYGIYDDSKNNHTVALVGDTRMVSAQGWFDSSSTVFDGTNDNLVINNHSSFDLRNQDWTIEAWIRPTGDWSKHNNIITKRGNGGDEGTDGDWQLYLHQSNGVLSFYPGTIGGQQSGAVPLINTWNHVAAVRNGQTITLYLNGISVLAFNADTLYTTNRKVYVGGWAAGNEYFYGHMNDIRVTRGVARYTSNFDPRLLTQSPANRVYGLTTVSTPYVFRARAQNSAGFGSYGSAVSTAVSTLGAPTNLTVIPDNDKAYVTWSAPSPNNSAIRDYSIQYSTNGGTSWTNYSHTASIDTSIVVSGLANNTSYDFGVAAINIAGTGSYVTTSSPVLTALRQDNTYNKTRLLLHLDGN